MFFQESSPTRLLSVISDFASIIKSSWSWLRLSRTSAVASYLCWLPFLPDVLALLSSLAHTHCHLWVWLWLTWLRYLGVHRLLYHHYIDLEDGQFLCFKLRHHHRPDCGTGIHIWGTRRQHPNRKLTWLFCDTAKSGTCCLHTTLRTRIDILVVVNPTNSPVAPNQWFAFAIGPTQ